MTKGVETEEVIDWEVSVEEAEMKFGFAVEVTVDREIMEGLVDKFVGEEAADEVALGQTTTGVVVSSR